MPTCESGTKKSRGSVFCIAVTIFENHGILRWSWCGTCFRRTAVFRTVPRHNRHRVRACSDGHNVRIPAMCPLGEVEALVIQVEYG